MSEAWVGRTKVRKMRVESRKTMVGKLSKLESWEKQLFGSLVRRVVVENYFPSCQNFSIVAFLQPHLRPTKRPTKHSTKQIRPTERFKRFDTRPGLLRLSSRFLRTFGLPTKQSRQKVWVKFVYLEKTNLSTCRDSTGN